MTLRSSFLALSTHGLAVCLAACLAVCLAVCLAGCNNSAEYIFVEGFEDECDGAPCLWTVQASTPGTARWNETLPGEHGIYMDGNPMAIIRDMSGIELENPPSGSNFVVDVAARCDAGALLTVEMSVEALASGATETYTASLTPPTNWDGTLDVRTLSSTSGMFGVFFRDIVALRVVKTGPGACELDYLAIRAEGFSF